MRRPAVSRALATFAAVIVASALFPRSAGAVSRVGNRWVVDDAAAARVEIPGSHVPVGSGAEGWLRLATFGLRPQHVDVLDFRRAYPEWADATRGALVDALSAAGWIRADAGDGAPACVEAHARASDDGTRVTIATWGAGRGFAFVSTDTAVNARAQALLLGSLALAEEECAWQNANGP